MPLTNALDCHTSLGYILFRDCKQVETYGACAIEFIRDDKDFMRRALLPLKQNVKYLVFIRNEKTKQFEQVQGHFQTLGDAAPYLQSGNRVLVEYARS